jgi:hypothetical protein
MNPRDLSAALAEAVTAQIHRLIALLPSIAAALLLTLAGWLIARVARAISQRLCEAILARFSKVSVVDRGLSEGSVRRQIPILVRETTFWAVFLIFLAAAVEQLQIPALSSPLEALAYYAPKLLSAMLIAALAYVAGNIANHWVSSTLMPVGAAQAQMLGRLAQVGTFSIGLVMAADQAGVESTILMLALGIVLTVTLGGVALAFAIGCAPIVGNIVAAHYASKQLAAGRLARLKEHSGIVREITSAFVVLENEQGEVLVPARIFLEETSVLADPGGA